MRYAFLGRLVLGDYPEEQRPHSLSIFTDHLIVRHVMHVCKPTKVID